MTAVIDEPAPGIEPLPVRVVVIDLQVERGDFRIPAARLHGVEDTIPDSPVAPLRAHVQLVDERVAPAVLEAEAAAEDPVAHCLFVFAREPRTAMERLGPQLCQRTAQNRLVV